MDKIRSFIWHKDSKVFGKRLWILFAIVVAVIAFVRPTERVITHHYSRAAFAWWNEDNMYDSSGEGFLYFPQSVFVYTPFAWQKFPEPLGEFNKKPWAEKFTATIPLRFAEALYRIVSVLLLGWAIWNLCLLYERKGALSLFFPVSLLAVPSSVTAAGNGQFNLLLASTTILACVCVARQKWNQSVFWLFLGMAVKPLGIVPLLLLVVLNRPLWGRSIIGGVSFMAVGFLHWNPAYAIRQWQLMIEQVMIASQPYWQEFDDIAGMAAKFGINLPNEVWFIVRAVMALFTLAVSFIACRKYTHLTATFLTTTLAAVYLMVFNPRTETNSYLIVAPYIGLMAAVMFRDKKSDWIAWFFVFVCIGLGSDNYGDIYKITRIWWKPLITLIFGGLLVWWIIKGSMIKYRIDNYPP